MKTFIQIILLAALVAPVFAQAPDPTVPTATTSPSPPSEPSAPVPVCPTEDEFGGSVPSCPV